MNVEPSPNSPALLANFWPLFQPMPRSYCCPTSGASFPAMRSLSLTLPGQSWVATWRCRGRALSAVGMWRGLLRWGKQRSGGQMGLDFVGQLKTHCRRSRQSAYGLPNSLPVKGFSWRTSTYPRLKSTCCDCSPQNGRSKSIDEVGSHPASNLLKYPFRDGAGQTLRQTPQ